MRPIFFKVLFACSVMLLTCSDNEDNLALITGEVEFISDNQLAKNVPLKLTIYDSDIPHDRSKPNNNIVQIISLKSDDNGLYSQEINLTSLPKNLTYQIIPDTVALISASKDYWPALCSSSPPIFTEDRTLYPGRNNKKILVDFTTFFQIAFDKVDHNSLDKIMYCFCLCGRETTIEKPDTTFLDILPFSFHPKISISYDLIRESGEIEENSIQDIVLTKNDTTKITVNY
jgi:hypothetical protein